MSGRADLFERNEVDRDDQTDFSATPPMGIVYAFVILLQFVCCGIPLLLLSGISLLAIFPFWPVFGGGVAVLGIVGFVWYLNKGRASGRGNPKRGVGCERPD